MRETYSDELAAAYIDGEFVNLTFGTVYKTYNRVAHRSNEAIKPDETLFIGCDFNVRRMAATVYVKRDGGNVWHVVRELVDMYDTSDLVETIKSKFPTHKVVIYPDASGASTSSKNANVSDIDMLKAARFEVRVKRANPSVRDRINAMNQALSKGRIFINDAKCPTVADCLERQSYNKNNDPDKSSGHDHQNDATTYPIAYEMPISKPVAHFRVGVIGRQ